MSSGLDFEHGKGCENGRMFLVPSYPLGNSECQDLVTVMLQCCYWPAQQTPSKGRVLHVTVVQHGPKWFMGDTNNTAVWTKGWNTSHHFSCCMCSFYSKYNWADEPWPCIRNLCAVPMSIWWSDGCWVHLPRKERTPKAVVNYTALQQCVSPIIGMILVLP